MKILLVNAPSMQPAKWGEPVAIYPPLGILYIASYLRKHLNDVSIEVIDGARLGFIKTLKNIRKKSFDILGISFTTWNSIGAKNLINILKEEDSKIFVVAGGPHPSALPLETLKESNIDVVAIGEGEETMLEIVKQFKNKKMDLGKINGIVFKKGGKYIFTKPRELLDVNLIPFPAWDLINIKIYQGLYWSKHRPETCIISSRGCPFNCTFCSNPVWKTNRPWMRLRSPSNIAKEVEILRNDFGIREISDECDTFNVNLKWALRVCQEIKKLGISWKAQIRANPMTNELAKALADSGCWLVRMGIESGNPETLMGIGKGITIGHVMKTCKKLKKYGIKVVGLFMIFNVWEENGKLSYENVNMCNRTLKFAKALLKQKLIDSFTWSFTTPFPGSKLYQIAKKYNLIKDENYEKWNQASNFVMNFPNINKKDIERIKMKGTILQAESMLKFFTLNPRSTLSYLQKCLLIPKILINQFM